MMKDPKLVNKNLNIMVKLLAEIINDFFEPLSYKTMGFLVLGVVVLCKYIDYSGKRA